MSISLQGRIWRAVLRSTIKRQRLTIPEHRAQGKKSAGLMGNLPENIRNEPLEIGALRAEWLIPQQADGRKVILHFHGGGYVTGSIEPYRVLGALLANSAGARVLLPEYRLAPEHPYPAALDDALSVYRWLLTHGHAPADIIFSGDSAGGGLAVAAALSLRDQRESLPAGVVCMSPWVDLTLKGASHLSKARAEAVLKTDTLREWSLAYTSADNLANPLVSPVFADFHGFPQLFIQVGSEEILLDDALLLAEKARAAGVQVELKVWEGLWHVWQVFGERIPENRQTFEEIGRFMRGRFSKE